MTEDKYLDGIIVILHDCEFVLFEYCATAKDGSMTKIILKNGVCFNTEASKNDINNAIFKAIRPQETIIPLDKNPKFSEEYLRGFLAGQRSERKQKIMFTPIQEVYNRWKDREGQREINIWCTDMWLAIKEYCEVTK